MVADILVLEENLLAMKERLIILQYLYGRLLLASRHDVMEGNQITSVVGFHLKDMEIREGSP